MRLSLSIAERARNASMLIDGADPERVIRDAMHAMACDIASQVEHWKPAEGQAMKCADCAVLADVAQDLRMVR